MLKLLSIIGVLLAVLGATGFYVNYGTASTEASRRSQPVESATRQDDNPIASNSLLLVGVGMIAAGVLGKRTMAGK